MPTRNAQNDRNLKFISNRILKADELIRMQDLDQARDVRGLGTIFKQGATLNTKVTVNGSTVSLGAADASFPMWVFVNGSFEQFAPASFNLDPSKVSGDDFIYLNWTIWRVTADGEGGTILDESLKDVSSGEKVAEAGQLELTVSTTDDSATALDEAKQFSKNTSPIVMFRLARGEGGSITVNYAERLFNAAAATKDLLGFVKLSTTTSQVAVADDDPRLSAGIPNRSINEIKIISGKQVTPAKQTPWFGVAEADITGAYGISSNCIYDVGTKTLLSDILPSMVALLQLALSRGESGGGGSTPAPTPYTPPPAPSVPSDHVGQPLGQSGTHPARLDSDTDGFTVKRKSAAAGSAGAAAFGVTKPDGTLLAGIMHDGDVKATKATATIGTTVLNTLSAIATALANHVASDTPGGGGGVAQSYVDTQDNAKLAEAKAYTDQKVSGGGIALNITQVATNIPWTILTINNLQVAFCNGPLQNEANVDLPDGFMGFQGTAGFGRSFTIFSADQLHCYLNGTTVVCYTQDRDGNKSTGDWANVQGICFKWA